MFLPRTRSSVSCELGSCRIVTDISIPGNELPRFWEGKEVLGSAERVSATLV